MLATKRVWAVLGFTLVSLVGSPLFAQDSTGSTPPDNTKVNKKARNHATDTADQAKNNNSDLETMRKIRRAVVKDKSLSSYAHNVKIVSKDGKVTLKGPVHTDDEKKNIEAKATEIAGAGNVMNEITVKGDSK